jgi:hypothetical protein
MHPNKAPNLVAEALVAAVRVKAFDGFSLCKYGFYVKLLCGLCVKLSFAVIIRLYAIQTFYSFFWLEPKEPRLPSAFARPAECVRTGAGKSSSPPG